MTIDELRQVEDALIRVRGTLYSRVSQYAVDINKALALIQKEISEKENPGTGEGGIPLDAPSTRDEKDQDRFKV